MESDVRGACVRSPILIRTPERHRESRRSKTAPAVTIHYAEKLMKMMRRKV
jgi:hypothetical protein